jgi:hypothetical protein
MKIEAALQITANLLSGRVFTAISRRESARCLSLDEA